MSYPKQGIFKFGKQLLETGDLDPIYIMLWKAKLPHSRLCRWLLAYWWFYHAGVASYISQMWGDAFYMRALRFAQTKGTPRGTERRHFRGKACLKSIEYFRDKYPRPEDAVLRLMGKCKTVDDVLVFVKKRWPLFGPWIGFKVADMLERLDLASIKFPYKTLELYSEPTKGAQLLCQREGWDYAELGVGGVCRRLEAHFKGFQAPPRYERVIGVQEAETCLCKWHSHIHGHYPLGKDTREIYRALGGWGNLAKRLQKTCRQEFTREQLGI